MINIMNGRVKYDDDYGSSINCFLVEGNVETPIYQLEDGSKFKVVDKESFPAIQGKDFKEGGAWTSYNIETDKTLLFKFHISHRSPDVEESGQFYFAYTPKYVRSYTTDIVSKNDSIFENKTSVVINGSCTYLPEKYLISRGVNYNKRLCNDRNFQQLINKIKII